MGVVGDVVGERELGAARSRLIAARLPLFSALWLCIGAVWSVEEVAVGGLTPVPAAMHVATMALAFAVASLLARRDPDAPRVRWIALMACLVVAASSSAILAHVGAFGEVLGFSHLMLGAVSAVTFAWGWRPALMLAGGMLLSWWVALPHLELFAEPGELWVGFVASLAIVVVMGELSARSLAKLWKQEAAERAARTELEASRDAYRDLAESARDHIWLTDRDGNITYVNEAAARFHQAPAELIVGLSIFDIITRHPSNPDAREALARVARGETLPPLLFQIGSPTGERYWHEVLVTAVRDADGHLVGTRGISRDMTQRVRDAERIRQSEERFRGAFAASSVGLSITDMSGRPLQLNDAACTILRRSREEMMRMTIDELTYPEDRAPTEAARQALLTGERDSLVHEQRFVCGDGTVTWGLVNASPLRDAQGNPIALIALIQDVNERHLADEALHRSNRDLAQSREKLRRLAMQQAAIREEERKRLGLDLHDDVCQELMGMSIMLESLRCRLEPMPAETRAEFARVAEVATGIGEHLRQVAHEMRPPHLGDLGLEGSLRSLASGLSTTHCAVETRFGTPIPRLHEASEVGVYRIAQEALSNALRHARAAHIELTARVDEETLHLEVRDDGRGFDGAERADGIGLVSMEERALALGGRLDVRSTEHEGTLVRLRCPLRRAEVLGEALWPALASAS